MEEQISVDETFLGFEDDVDGEESQGNVVEENNIGGDEDDVDVDGEESQGKML